MFSAQAHKAHKGYEVIENGIVFQDLLGLVRVMRLCGGGASYFATRDVQGFTLPYEGRWELCLETDHKKRGIAKKSE